MATCRKRISDSGLQVVLLENDVMAVSLAPEAGGKIIEIIDKRSGRNWLWQNPHVPIRQTANGLIYASELDSGGWDEILFSIAPCEITLDGGEEYSIPDHGDLVGQAWKIESAMISDSGHAICNLTTTGDVLPYHWRRVASLHPDKPSLTLSYALENTGSRSLPFLWCAHPLLAVDDGMQIELPVNQTFLIDHTMGLSVRPANSDYGWPKLPLSDRESINLATCFDSGSREQDFAAKIFVSSATPGAVGVHTTDDMERLTIRYDQNKSPWMGLWINKQGWSGGDGVPYLNLGVEPSTAPCDSHVDAMAQGWAEQIPPGQSRAWSLDIGLLE